MKRLAAAAGLAGFLCGCAPPSLLKGTPVLPGAGQPVEQVAGAEETTQVTAELMEEAPPIYVHVCGCVRSPGVYSMPADSRRMDAVAAAGGLTEDADEEGCNLAEKISDGEQVRIPSRKESADGGRQEFFAGTERPQKVNLNTAGREELMTLSGIGEAKAAEIIRYRESQGPFRTIEDIMQVSGIGKAAFEKIRDRIKV